MSEYICNTEDKCGMCEAYRTAEPIVRCRDCRYFDKYPHDEITVCYRFDNEEPIVEPDGFCAWGERREGAESGPLTRR